MPSPLDKMASPAALPAWTSATRYTLPKIHYSPYLRLRTRSFPPNTPPHTCRNPIAALSFTRRTYATSSNHATPGYTPLTRHTGHDRSQTQHSASRSGDASRDGVGLTIDDGGNKKWRHIEFGDMRGFPKDKIRYVSHSTAYVAKSGLVRAWAGREMSRAMD